MDGNFRLSQINKQSDPNDVPLNNGNAYFVNEQSFADFLKVHDDSSMHVSHRWFPVDTLYDKIYF